LVLKIFLPSPFSTLFSFGPGLNTRICSAEDLVVLKLFASVILHKHQLDWTYIEDHLRPLVEAKREPGVLDTLAGLRGL
jgi:hypothetical protein